MVQQEEHDKQIIFGRDHHVEQVRAFAVRERFGTAEKPMCRHCGKYGHDESECYEIIGYPASWGS